MKFLKNPIFSKPILKKITLTSGLIFGTLLVKNTLFTPQISLYTQPDIPQKTLEILYHPENKLQELDAKNLAQIIQSKLKQNFNVIIKASENIDLNKKSAFLNLKLENGNAKISRKNIGNLENYINQKTEIKTCENLYEVCEYLKLTNKNYFDSTIICYFPDKDWEKFMKDPQNKNLVNRLLLENNGFIRINSKKLAKKMELMKKGFYKYYKPSFLNGFGQFSNLNIEYWQITESQCRNKIDFSLRNSPKIHESNDVEFHFKKSYKELLSNSKNSKPIVYIYWDKNAIIWPFMDQITKFARKYDTDCDFIFEMDRKKCMKYFNMSEIDENFPYVFIIDKENRATIKNPISGENMGSYPKIYSDVALLMFGVEEGSKFLDKYFDGKLTYIPQSKRMSKPTLVKTLNKETFKTNFLENPNVSQCVIQIYKHNCASCFYNSKSFDILSFKLQKYGFLDQLPLYKLRSDNEVPELGTFPYTPMYMYLKKGNTPETQNSIVEIVTLESPQKFEIFKEKLEKASKLDLKDIKLNPAQQFEKYIKKEDKLADFDFDFESKIIPENMLKNETQKSENPKSENEKPENLTEKK